MDRIAKLRELLQGNPSDSFLQHALALEYIKLGDDEMSRKLFEELLERDPAYVGSYYHLGKLFERRNDTAEAIKWYEKGMKAAMEAGDNHAWNELRGAYDDLV
jgi:Tfp pilus assembly protein PilF